jgi:hypothetical protein
VYYLRSYRKIMDYFTIIRRLGLFQDRSAPKINLPPIITISKSCKQSPASKLSTPVDYGSEAPMKKISFLPQRIVVGEKNKKAEAKNYEKKVEVRIGKVEQSGLKNAEIKVNGPKRLAPIVVEKQKLGKNKEEISGLSAWSRASSFVNSRF